jgi:hypothetical protein
VNDFSGLTAALSVPLPQQYRDFLLHYPPELRQAKYFDNAKHGGPADFELLADPQQIVEFNQREREFWPESDYADVEFPSSYLLIGHDGCGNLFAIDTSVTGACPVIEFDHELSQWSRRTETIDQFARQLQDIAIDSRRRKK